MPFQEINIFFAENIDNTYDIYNIFIYILHQYTTLEIEKNVNI